MRPLLCGTAIHGCALGVLSFCSARLPRLAARQQNERAHASAPFSFVICEASLRFRRFSRARRLRHQQHLCPAVQMQILSRRSDDRSLRRARCR